MRIDRIEAERLDRADPFAGYRNLFRLPPGIIYLDGNSLGPLPESVPARIDDLVNRAWGSRLIRGWQEEGWMDLPGRVGGRIARLIGADQHEVLAADSTSANLYKLAAAACAARPERTVILTEERNFPTDCYMLEGLVRLIERLGGRLRLRKVPRIDVLSALNEDTVLIALTHVDYKSCAMWDMAKVADAARACGAVSLFDLSHSAGAVPINLNGAGIDLAVGCGYKFLNGGPGAPGFLFVAGRHHGILESPLAGWMGHAAPFDFADEYIPAAGIGRFACGTPPVIGLVALDTALEIYEDVDLEALHLKAMRLCDIFLAMIEGLPGVVSSTPTGTLLRGAHVALSHPDAPMLIERLADMGVIGDFRPPDIMRFGFGALYTSHVDALLAGRRLAGLIADCHTPQR